MQMDRLVAGLEPTGGDRRRFRQSAHAQVAAAARFEIPECGRAVAKTSGRLAPGLAQQHEVGIDAVKLVEETIAHPLATADFAPAAERLAKDHEPDLGDRRERLTDVRAGLLMFL